MGHFQNMGTQLKIGSLQKYRFLSFLEFSQKLLDIFFFS